VIKGVSRWRKKWTTRRAVGREMRGREIGNRLVSDTGYAVVEIIVVVVVVVVVVAMVVVVVVVVVVIVAVIVVVVAAASAEVPKTSWEKEGG